MSACYNLIYIKGNYSLIESYAGQKAALEKAKSLAIFDENKLLNPSKEFKNGNQLFVLINDLNNSLYLAIQFTYIETKPVFPEYDDPYHKDLPAGWTLDNKPATIETLISDPENVKSIYSLTDKQKYTLTLARINKRKQYHTLIFNAWFDQDKALSELKLSPTSALSAAIIDNELNIIENYAEELMLENI